MEIIWSVRAENDYIKDLDYLEENYGNSAVLLYMEHLADALESIRAIDTAIYQLIDAQRNIRKYKVTKTKNLYYRIIESDNRLELIAFYSDKQDPDKLKL